MKDNVNIEVADAIDDIAVLANRFQLLLFDFLGRYFETSEASDNFISAAKSDYHYKVMQAKVESLCDCAYDIHERLDKLQEIAG